MSTFAPGDRVRVISKNSAFSRQCGIVTEQPPKRGRMLVELSIPDIGPTDVWFQTYELERCDETTRS